MTYIDPRFLVNYLTASLLLVVACISSCGNNTGNNEIDQTVIEIGNFKVSLQEFEAELTRAKAKGLDDRESYQQLVDKYISAGLLVALANKSNLDQNDRYKRQLAYYKNKLYAYFSKLRRLQAEKFALNIGSTDGEIYKAYNVIDYIRVPKKYKALSKDILDRLHSGSSVDELTKSDKFYQWDSLHVQFYTNLSTESAPFTEDMLANIEGMPIGVFKVFATESGYHLIKVIRRFPLQASQQSTDHLVFNLTVAKAIEQGDTVFDPYVVNKTLSINEALLASIPFQIEPLFVADGDVNDDPQIAEFLGKKIYKKQLIQQIGLLPVNIQSVFKNRSTRSLKIVNFILAANADLYNKKASELSKSRMQLTRFFNSELGRRAHTDTLAGLIQIIEDRLRNTGSNKIELPFHYTDQTVQSEQGTEPVPPIGHPGKRSTHAWVYDDNLPGKEYVKLNFPAIDKIEIPDAATTYDQQIIARSPGWTLKVFELKEALSRLTPESRVAISENNSLERLIRYLRDSEEGSPNNQSIVINEQLLDIIDVVGSSLDSLNSFKSNDVVGSFMHVKLTASETIGLTANLPAGEHKKFTSDLDFRKEAFKQLLINEFWKKQINQHELDKDPAFTRRLLKCRNWLLSNMYYEANILVDIPETSDEHLNQLLRHAGRIISDKRLLDALKQQATITPVKMNKELLAKHGVVVGKSAFNFID